jgi:hypothetical protein
MRQAPAPVGFAGRLGNRGPWKRIGDRVADETLVFVSAYCKETGEEYAIYGQSPFVIMALPDFQIPEETTVRHAQFECDTFEECRELQQLFDRFGPAALDKLCNDDATG